MIPDFSGTIFFLVEVLKRRQADNNRITRFKRFLRYIGKIQYLVLQRSILQNNLFRIQGQPASIVS